MSQTAGSSLRGRTKNLATVLVLMVFASALLLAIGWYFESMVYVVCGGIVGLLVVVGILLTLGSIARRVVARQDEVNTRLSRLESSTNGMREEVDEANRSLATRERSTQQRIRNIHKDLQVLRRRVPASFLKPIEGDVARIDSTGRETLRIAFEAALQMGRNPRAILTDAQATRLFNDYLERGQFLNLRPLIEHFGLLNNQSLTSLRALYKYYRKTGYWEMALSVIERIFEISGRETDEFAAEKLRKEIEVFASPTDIDVKMQAGQAYSPYGPILHMVGRVLPETQTGYTLRTQYTAMAQKRKGLRVAIVGQSGISGDDIDEGRQYTYQGIDYYLLPGAPRNESTIDEWLRHNVLQLSSLVRDLKPSILHAQSDFFNALIVNAVGRFYGIPTVYESRGFWEESWLSRSIDANDWSLNSRHLFEMYGEPDAYVLRKHAEEVARAQPDHVFTLAEVMKRHIENSSVTEIADDYVSLVPNAVELNNFPKLERDRSLSSEIGIPDGTVTIGYISSVVEYEGIDTLIDAFEKVQQSSGVDICLLLVGDGDYLPNLKEIVEQRGIPQVFFTGRVAHEDVLRYYSLIDIFVVPRKASTVTNLVTPLKPFEAFSTGRTIIVSDVGALQEIADQSGAMETFRAGSSDSLAERITYLLDNPEIREAMGARGREWVKNHRSWDNNVNEYYRVYRKLGYLGGVERVVPAELRLRELGANAGELVTSLSQSELPSLSGWFSIQESRQTAAEVLTTGWKFASFEPVPVAEISDWSTYGKEHRSWGFHLHAWEFMDSLLQAYDSTNERIWLEEALDIALRWLSSHESSDADTDDEMAWYDMSLSLRTPRLIALTLRASKYADLRDSVVILADGVARHMQELHKDRAFNPNNNHGFYTAISQVHCAKYAYMVPGASEAAAEGAQRLTRMAETQFAQDGVHLEHSPDYHRMLLSSFERGVNDGLIMDSDVRDRVRRAAHVLGWMIQPDGALVQFGDSPETVMVKPDAESIDPETEYILSDGHRGTRPNSELGVFHKGGYAFVRSPQPQAADKLHESSYLAFSAAFHSRAHKHADDLNVVWFDHERQILTDGGRYGYGDLLPQGSPLRKEGFYYAAPERQYVEGTMAHNTLMMDGTNQDRRSREPYGGAIGTCVEDHGVFDLSGRVHHSDYIHRRRVVFEPGARLRIKDSIFSQSPDNREGILWFNIDGGFDLISAEGPLVFETVTGNSVLHLEVTGPGRLIDPVRGQKEPMRGWRSRKDRTLEAVWSVGFAISIDTRASVETAFNLSTIHE